MQYQWKSAQSPIKSIEIYAPHKELEALIFAPKGLAQEKLWEISDSLKRLGYTAEPDMVGDEGVLRVKNFKTSQHLISTLQTDNFVAGSFSTQRTAYDRKDKEKLRPQQKTGLLYMAGDTVLMATGAMRNGWLNGKSLWQAVSSGPGKKDITAGLKWFSAGLLLYFFGAKNPDKQVHYAYDDFLKTLDKNNIDISPDDRATLRTLAQHHKGVLAPIERIARDNPLVINSVLQAMGGLDAAMAGVHQKRPVTGNPNYIKSASGMSTLLGHSTALLTQEKTTEEKKESAEIEHNPNRSLLERFDDWRREKKYRIAGSGSLFASLLRLIGGYQEVKINSEFLAQHPIAPTDPATLSDFNTISNAKHASKIEWGVNCVKAVANWYYALAGQSVNTDIKKLGILEEIGNTVAHIAVKHPAGEERASFVSSMATILAGQGNIENSVQEITEVIDKKISLISTNPWERPNHSAAPFTTTPAERSLSIDTPRSQISNHPNLNAQRLMDVPQQHAVI